MLVSWHYLRTCVDEALPYITQARVVLDSGAFSAFNSGKPISLLEYARFLRGHAGIFDWCASLDVIGDPERSYANWQALRASCPSVVPAVHCGADLQWLTRYMNEGAPRIALGGLVPYTKTLRDAASPARQWLDTAFSMVQGAQVAVHGFGVTGRSIVLAYPWTTVDSSVALAATRYRKIVQADGRLVFADVAVICGNDARRVADSWEVRGASPTRRARLNANLTGVEQALDGSTLLTMYHAIVPSGCSSASSDFSTVVHHLQQRARGLAQVLVTESPISQGRQE
jgi:hypothetical protein